MGLHFSFGSSFCLWLVGTAAMISVNRGCDGASVWASGWVGERASEWVARM